MATEVSIIGIVYGLVCGIVVYRKFDVKGVLPMLIDTASLSGAILLIIGAATGMAWGLTQSGFSQTITQAMTDLNGGPNIFPVARQLGVHEVHYAMVVILSMGIGLFALPLGVGYYAACAIGKVNPDEGVGPIVGYLLALLIGILVIAFVPWLSIGFLS